MGDKQIPPHECRYSEDIGSIKAEIKNCKSSIGNIRESISNLGEITSNHKLLTATQQVSMVKEMDRVCKMLDEYVIKVSELITHVSKVDELTHTQEEAAISDISINKRINKLKEDINDIKSIYEAFKQKIKGFLLAITATAVSTTIIINLKSIIRWLADLFKHLPS